MAAQKVTVVEIGDELGFILPDDLADPLGWKAGDDVTCIQSGNSIMVMALPAAPSVAAAPSPQPDDGSDPQGATS